MDIQPVPTTPIAEPVKEPEPLKKEWDKGNALKKASLIALCGLGAVYLVGKEGVPRMASLANDYMITPVKTAITWAAEHMKPLAAVIQTVATKVFKELPQWLFNNAIRPITDRLGNFLAPITQRVDQMVGVLIDHVLKPVGTQLVRIGNLAKEYIFTPLSERIMGIANKFIFPGIEHAYNLWAPVGRVVAKLYEKVKVNVLVPGGETVYKIAHSALIAGPRAAYYNVVAPTAKGLAGLLEVVNRKAVTPVMQAIRNVSDKVLKGVVQPALEKMGRSFVWLNENVITPMRQALYILFTKTIPSYAAKIQEFFREPPAPKVEVKDIEIQPVQQPALA